MSEKTIDIKAEGAFYRKKFFLSIIIPGIIIILMWLMKAVEVLLEADFSRMGIHPLNGDGIPGIFLSPFIHSGVDHLFSNTLPLLLLSVALFFFYSEVATRIMLMNYLITGFLVWIGGRDAWHIGASGLVYGLGSFLFFSGIIRKYFRLVALSLLIVFLYGEMAWGIFPGPEKNISWESHMLGVISGIILAIVYRKEGPQEPVYEWPEDEEEGDEERGGEEEKK